MQAQAPADEKRQEERVALGTQVLESTRRRLRRYAVDHEVDMRDVVNAALDQYLRERDY